MKLKKISTMALAAILSATSVAPAIIPATPVMAYDNSQYLNVREAELFKGDNLQLKVNGVYNDTRIVWKSDNSSVAEVSSNGLVRAKKAGFANITAEIVQAPSGYGNSSGNVLHCKVYVNEVPQISSNVTFSQGTSALIRYQGGGIPIKFVSSNKSIANPTGLRANEKWQDCLEVDCLNPGTTKIKIYFDGCGNNMESAGVYKSVKAVTCNVTVKANGALIDKIAPKTDASTRRAFKNLGYKVKLSSTFKYNGAEFNGGFNRASKTITLTRLNNRDIYYEMGIFIAAATNSANTAEFKKIYAAEKKKAQFYGDDPLEYFAQEYENMMIGEKVSGVPKTTAYIKKMIKKMSTLSTSTMQKNISKVKVERASIL